MTLRPPYTLSGIDLYSALDGELNILHKFFHHAPDPKTKEFRLLLYDI